MKKIFLTLTISILCNITYANENKINKNEEIIKNINLEIDFKQNNEEKPLPYTYSLDCDNDGITDYYFEGYMEPEYFEDMIAMVISSC